ncbi:MAG: RNA polymerase-binding protein DksA [Pseudomonadota bacterium]|nr:RNA polymerase-binding protein DksA [Pseudomonadota bacterium]
MSLMKLLGIDAYTDLNNENYMSEKQKLHFKKILKSWKRHLANTTQSELQNPNCTFSDLSDRASHEEELLLLLKKQSREGKLIDRIDKTIQTIDKGSYGFCKVCDCEIGIPRLEARPVAEQCIDCKSLAEESERLS